MSAHRLHLYSIFHANLSFSSIPKDHYALIAERCFWPVIKLLDEFEDVKFGFEFPGETLEALEALDPELVAAVRGQWYAGRCEVIASGYAQVIFPLVPNAVNERNLELGDETYERILGRRPTVAYINEQTYSQGILGLYVDRGYRAIVADWDNTVAYRHYPSSYRYFPQWAVGDGARLPVLWNSSIAFQKLQRYLGGAIALDDYLAYVGAQWSPEEDRGFPMYGNDWEILDYRPGEPPPLRAGSDRVELGRLRRLLERLSDDDRFTVEAPSDALAIANPQHEVHLESTEYPIPCKKQDKYNVTRWAVCGREATLMNTQSHQLAQRVAAAEALGSRQQRQGLVPDELNRELVSLWGSDFRTFATEEKYVDFRNRMGVALANASESLDRALGEAPPGNELRFYNPNDFAWEGAPYEFRVELGPGEARPPLEVSIGGRPLPTQLEDVELRPDGSLRRARIVICPSIPPRSWVSGRLVAGQSSVVPPAEMGGDFVNAKQVRAKFNRARGATLRAVSFPAIGEEPLAATLDHGYFESVGLSPDWYTGGVIIFDQFNRKLTDLVPTDLVIPEVDDPSTYPVRIPVRCRIELGAGTLWKTIYVYRDAPRLDLSYHFRFQDLEPHSIRLGIVTVNPKAFDRKSLRYLTVNGGREPEAFELAGHRVAQDDPVSLNVSSHHCLGASEGWVAVADDTKGLAVMSNKAECYSVPMVHYEEVENSYFMRVYTSLAESDETAAQLWRGHSRITIRYVGYGSNVDAVRRESIGMNAPLLTLGTCSRPD